LRPDGATYPDHVLRTRKKEKKGRKEGREGKKKGREGGREGERPRCWWLTPIILATQEAEIRKITIGSRPGQIVP
jgi:hypothetical protein